MPVADTPKSDLHPATIAAHAGGAADAHTAGVVPGIHMATTFVRDENYDPVNPDNVYLRSHNENVRVAEDLLSKLEGAAETLLFPSGMAAVAAVFRTVPTGASVVVQSQIYWGTTAWIRDFCTRRGIALHEIDASDPISFEIACKVHKPALIWIETPSNPWLRITDVTGAARMAHDVGAKLVVDSTAATPVLSQPLTLGADIVMHSATKGINGHSDVLAGSLSTAAPQDDIWKMIVDDRNQAGAVMGPMEAWLLTRGMRTLPLRMREMSRNALKIAEYLQDHPQVEAVLYPGLPDHPGHEIAKRQMTGGYGGLLSFVVKGGGPAALKATGRLQLFLRATSLGGVESLVEHRHTIEPHTGIPEGLLRLSVGIEDAGDLIADLGQALGQ
ncbi:aminotransferase class I/II-fold pyridoxal phosphate-dependent enzyme [Sulfitobacter mediterraneus]|uniref:trans-sulfuration enzyme family protein n=1 Tax=Sulfitobacter mediterraneus TaxID=83219 RepID=UPI00193234DB|nr:aminotransferase class I/II-fold pyridoxal phosphate-dependent enzyme [Sulfitobacter mediterraneus]MBM1311826.1 aminotransferase class I/II-fold pyridoxal phosphate-dependent enzyme [Sulfitobacter mediterraneus]MBM1315707.1 aminotransferase class I/II-fold pyridoxal phosphate-dependent enzyme [Sulfitobacter mediterraneus]MBM1324069.1 aminotransferase class I/II-fold pyridoxal phosphate-dependent enzyme [Sulfitobacter mediterraneus]MBM1327981.1 aminotransferase class I/II-fold pyridoxal phosp